jgi:hypothetical protein
MERLVKDIGRRFQDFSKVLKQPGKRYCQLVHRNVSNCWVKKKKDVAAWREAWESEQLADQFHVGDLIPDPESGLQNGTVFPGM